MPINLAEEGLSPGDDISPYLEAIEDGEEVEVPAETYEFHGASVSADNWTFHGNGCTLDAQGDVTFNPNGHDWTFTGVRFDVQSGNVHGRLQGGDWEFSNCAWDGENTQVFPLNWPYVEEGTSATIANCWFGDGLGRARGESAIKSNSDGDGFYAVRGELNVKGCYFNQNGCYAAASAHPGQPGRAHFEDCYFEDAYLACIRTGSINGTCYVDNCTFNLEDYDDVPETGSGQVASRGVWAYWGTVEVTNCDIYYPGHLGLVAYTPKGDAKVVAKNCEMNADVGDNVHTQNMGNNPSREPPEGCVTSVEEAVTGSAPDDGTIPEDGEGDEGGLGEYDHVIILDGANEQATYEFEVDGEVEPSNTNGATFDPEDSISDSTVSGSIHGGLDAYKFNGDLLSLSVDGQVNDVALDGESINPDDYNQEDESDDSDESEGDENDDSDEGSQQSEGPREIEVTVKLEGDISVDGDIDVGSVETEEKN